ncbi:uncharacterized protein LOC106158229 [Lingula anatina]|uniref:Uncharacterized protein LOC106158229 n=1 Tax=Lingula anatina TaxID=7574 RepID=A0A1S3HX05_LINAN|nr:uncharacterized protein LOC106158229 [Lingula anatina]|eukprot:XP_013389594.1 uncharacterized protein LOC106158229 [Lingula anatina]
MTSVSSATGYGPRGRLLFNGDEKKYELWETKFLGYLHLQGLKQTILPGAETPEDFHSKNETAYAELIQCLDDRSLSLVMRDAENDGRKALMLLRDYHLGKGKPRVIAMYSELSSLQKETEESITDYIIRAENAAAALDNAGETVNDALLIAMILKGLPVEYKAFSVVLAQGEKELDFTQFKVALKNYDDTEKSQTDTSSKEKETVMKVSSSSRHVKRKDRKGHVSFLVDCGATSHIVTDKSKFIEFDKNFDPDKHFIELADGTRTNGIAQGRGKVNVSLTTADGNVANVTLDNALYVPSYKQNIFSVQAATEKGCQITFNSDHAEMIATNGTIFDIEKHGRLYYLYSINVNSEVKHSLEEWHKVLGHCNVRDIEKLESVVKDMKITDRKFSDCEVCTMGKMTQHFSRVADSRAK